MEENLSRATKQQERDRRFSSSQRHKALGPVRTYQRSAGIRLPCSHAAAYTLAVGWCQVTELDRPCRCSPPSAFLLLAGNWHQLVPLALRWTEGPGLCRQAEDSGQQDSSSQGGEASERSLCQLQPARGSEAGRVPDGSPGLRLHSHRKC